MQVAMRIRPKLDNVVVHEHKSLLHLCNDNIFTEVDNCKIAERVIYDYMLGQSDDNRKVYTIVRPMVDSFIHGTNGTIFVYGQRSSGKHYTLYGAYNDLGIVYLMLNQVTSYFSLNSNIKYTLKAAFVEVTEDDKLIDLHDVVIKECAKTGVQFTNDVGDLLEKGRFLYHSHNHVILSFNLEYNVPNENRTSESQFNFVILADPTGKDKDKDHNHFMLSLLFTYLHLLNIDEDDIDMDKMLISSVLSKAVGKNAKSLFIGTISPSDPKNSLITIRKMKLIKGPDTTFDRLTNYNNQMPDILLDEFKFNEETCECDINDIVDEDDDEEQDFVTRVDLKHRKYVTEIPHQFYKQLDSMGLLISTEQTNEISCFTISQDNDEIGSSQMVFLPDNLLPTTMAENSVFYDNETFAEIYKEEHKLQMDLSKIRGVEPFDLRSERDIDLLQVAIHTANSQREQEIQNKADVAGCSTPQEDSDTSEIEFNYIDYDEDAESTTSQQELSDNENPSNEEETVECKRHKHQIQRLKDLLMEHQQSTSELEFENMQMKNEIEQQRNLNKEKSEYIKKLKSTLYSIVNKEVYKAKFIYKSNVKMYDKYYQNEVDNLRKLYVLTQDFTVLINKDEDEKRRRFLTTTRKVDIQGAVSITCNTNIDNCDKSKRDVRRIQLVGEYANQIDVMKKNMSFNIEKMQNRFKKMAETYCVTCLEKHHYFTLEEDYFQNQSKQFNTTLNRASLMLYRNVAYFDELLNSNKAMLRDNVLLENHVMFMHHLTKHIRDNDQNEDTCHRMFVKKMTVKTSLHNLRQLENDIRMEIASSAQENEETDETEEENISERMAGLGLPETPIDNKFIPRASGLVNSAIILESLLSIIYVIYNNMHRFLSEKVHCEHCKQFTHVLHYKIIQLVTLKSQFSFWSKNISLEDATIELYLNLTNELLEMTPSIRDSKRLRLMQYKLYQRKIYFDNCMTLLVNKRTFVNKVLTILIAASGEFQDLLTLREGHDENCRYRMINYIISLLFSQMRERIIITLFYLDNLDELMHYQQIVTRINELDVAIYKNEKCLRDICPGIKNPEELKNMEVELAYLMSLYNTKLMRIDELEEQVKLIPQAAQIPREFAQTLGPTQNATNSIPLVSELTVTTTEHPKEIPICTTILRAKQMIDSSRPVGTDGTHEPILLNNVTPQEYALKMLDVQQTAENAPEQQERAPEQLERASEQPKRAPEQPERPPMQYNPRKRPIESTEVDQRQMDPYRFPIASTSRATATPRPLKPPMSFLQMRFKGPASKLQPKVQFKPKYLCGGQYAIRSKPMFKIFGEPSESHFSPHIFGRQSPGSFEPHASGSSSQNKFVQPAAPRKSDDSSSDEDEECTYEDVSSEEETSEARSEV